jgi:hypothetical protein
MLAQELWAGRPSSPVEEFFEPLLQRSPGGGAWLPALLQAVPHGNARLGELALEPGYIDGALTVPGLGGRRTCFHRPVAPPPALIEWFLEHPERLSWPRSAGQLSSEARRLRRALVRDEPPGARARAQSRARELASIRSAFAHEWWRFEETFEPDCLLITDRLALSFVGASERLEPVSDWYPERHVLHRALEAARVLADDRAWGTIVLSPTPLPDATEKALRGSLAAGTPHLDAMAREQLAAGYLGNLTWKQAEAAVAAASSAARPPQGDPRHDPTS